MNQLLIKKRNEKVKKKKGFTLVELIIVIAIIGILAAIAIPKFGSTRESANQKADLATAKNIATVVATKIADGEDIENYNGEEVTQSLVNMDGDITPKSKDETAFYIHIDDDDNISISYDASGEKLVYPTTDSDNK